MTGFFNPANWYWKVSGSTSQVYSSARNCYVPITDAAYVTWLADGNKPTPIDVETDIWMYVSTPPRSLPAWLFNGTTFAQPSPTTYTAPQLAAYAAVARYNKETAGITVSGIAVPTDRTTQAQLAGAFNYATNISSVTLQWKLADGTFVSLDAAEISAIAIAVASHVQACFAAEATMHAEIMSSSPSVTTLAQIDAAFAAVTP